MTKFNRFATQKDETAIQNFILDIVKEQLNKRQMIDSLSRNFLRFLTSVCGYMEIRLLASQKMETWLQNPKVYALIYANLCNSKTIIRSRNHYR